MRSAALSFHAGWPKTKTLSASSTPLCWTNAPKDRVLQEAHERAVVTWADRRAFWAVVQATLQTQGIEAGGSLKARSKRLRSV